MSIEQEYMSMAANGICHSALMMQNSFQETCWVYQRPSVVFKPRLFLDGNGWIALFGEDLQIGVVGTGNSPAEAMYDFDKQWEKKQENK